jgi:hypothetical protein
MSETFGYHELERAALAFVLESETWPVFLAWAKQGENSLAVREWLNSNPSLNKHRQEWAAHSSDPVIRDLANDPAIRELMEHD